jgi:hypothetical protein
MKMVESLEKMEGEHCKEAFADEYQIMDTQTKKAVGSTYKGPQRNRARDRAEQMNQEHGSVRYIVQPIWKNESPQQPSSPKEAMDFTSIAPLLTPDRKLTDNEIARALRLSIAAELDAAHTYELIADAVEDKKVKETMLSISQEEKVHIGEFTELLETYDKDYKESVEEGRKEVTDK